MIRPKNRLLNGGESPPGRQRSAATILRSEPARLPWDSPVGSANRRRTEGTLGEILSLREHRAYRSLNSWNVLGIRQRAEPITGRTAPSCRGRRAGGPPTRRPACRSHARAGKLVTGVDVDSSRFTGSPASPPSGFVGPFRHRADTWFATRASSGRRTGSAPSAARWCPRAAASSGSTTHPVDRDRVRGGVAALPDHQPRSGSPLIINSGPDPPGSPDEIVVAFSCKCCGLCPSMYASDLRRRR